MSAKDIMYKKEVVTPEDFLELYNDVVCVINQLGGNEKDLHVEIRYKIGAITENAKSVEEFIKDTYGRNDFILNSYFIWYILIEELKVSSKIFSVCDSIDKKYINIKAENKIELMKIEKLFLGCFAEKKDTENTTNFYNSTFINGDGNIVATGDANIIQDNNNILNNHLKPQLKKENKFMTFCKAIVTNVISNFVYYLIGLLIVAIISIFNMNL